jgi:hypothetical protein
MFLPHGIKESKNDAFHVKNTKKNHIYDHETDIKIDVFHFHWLKWNPSSFSLIKMKFSIILID